MITEQVSNWCSRMWEYWGGSKPASEFPAPVPARGNPSRTSLEGLPEELRQEIFNHIENPRDMIAFANTSATLRNSAVWHPKYRQAREVVHDTYVAFHHLRSPQPLFPPGGHYREGSALRNIRRRHERAAMYGYNARLRRVAGAAEVLAPQDLDHFLDILSRQNRDLFASRLLRQVINRLPDPVRHQSRLRAAARSIASDELRHEVLAAVNRAVEQGRPDSI